MLLVVGPMRSIQAPERFPPSVRASIAQRYFVQTLTFGSLFGNNPQTRFMQLEGEKET